MDADLPSSQKPSAAQPGRAQKSQEGQQGIKGGGELAPISTSKVGHTSDLPLIRLNKFFSQCQFSTDPLLTFQSSRTTYLL